MGFQWDLTGQYHNNIPFNCEIPVYLWIWNGISQLYHPSLSSWDLNTKDMGNNLISQL
jgi:hypothetical protein